MTTRQEIYDRIRESSRNEVILEEMIRLGFWPSEEELPTSPATEIRRMGELQRELRALTTENQRLTNVESIRRQQRHQRLAESKRKRKENKQKKLDARKNRAEAWQKKKKRDITYLGPRHSAGLSNRESNLGKLSSNKIQPINTVDDLARCMGLSIGLLRFLAFGRRTSTTTHYHRFAVKKKTGGVRVISAPMPRLKSAQRWVLDHVLNRVPMHDAAHGFRPGRSIVTNATAHVGASIVLNMDLQDFFPTVNYRRVKGLFRNLGFSEANATVLGMICCEPEIAEIEIDNQTYFVAKGERFLPQGAPTSPAITNLICRGLDARLQAIADKLGFVYTRYADDITFSSKDSKADVGRAIRQIKHVVSDENFKLHPNKTRILRTGRRLEVTGLTVNERVSVPRKQLRNFRATLQQIERDGPSGKRWGSSQNVIASIVGYANFVSMVEPEKGNRFQEQVVRIIAKWGRGDSPFVARSRWVEPAQSDESPIPMAPTSLKGSQGKSKAAKQSEQQSSPKKPTTPKEQKPWWKIW